VGKPHQLKVFGQKHRHILEFGARSLPMVDWADVKIKPAELYLLPPTVNKKRLVDARVILSHNQKSVVFRRWERQQRL